MMFAKRLYYSVLWALLCFPLLALANLAAGDDELSVTVNGDSRPYLVHVPR